MMRELRLTFSQETGFIFTYTQSKGNTSETLSSLLYSFVRENYLEIQEQK